MLLSLKTIWLLGSKVGDEKSESSDPPPNIFSAYGLCAAKFGPGTVRNYTLWPKYPPYLVDVSEYMCQIVVNNELVSIVLTREYDVVGKRIHGLYLRVCDGKQLVNAMTEEQFLQQLGNKSEPILVELSRQLGLEKRVENT